MKKNLTAHNKSPKRLDQYIAEHMGEFSRSRLQALIKNGNVLLNNKQCKAKQQVTEGDLIEITIPEELPQEPQPENISLWVLHEDEHIIVLNKASGMVVHPAAGNGTGTLVNALLHHCNSCLSSVGGTERPGIVHRLDKDTSGCIIAAKSDIAHTSLVEQFAQRTTQKEYLTIVQGVPNETQGSIKTTIGRHPVNRLKMAVLDADSGKESLTDYQLLSTNPELDSSLILCTLHTGRTHQIRVHMTHLGCPIIADPIYSKISKQQAQPGRLMLHARKLSITHPVSQERLTFLAPIPEEFSPWTQLSNHEALNP